MLYHRRWWIGFPPLDILKPFFNALEGFTTSNNINHLLELESWMTSFINLQPSAKVTLEWLQSVSTISNFETTMSLTTSQAKNILFDITTNFQELYRKEVVKHSSNIGNNGRRLSIINV
jgi:hypothetical protein